ncbi:MAG: hypothetical protein JNN10_06540 [Sphingopyxis sp.]|uniref:hypothetical protein n=1 Tax=Sphingopyxis sp. TaxID=1908224 RepID=UPI001A45B7E1|nr:hypothetical protein [Sphingopyxis sp.]MBL9065933.1 hypothetical protein [Sphingopyxis sp.]
MAETHVISALVDKRARVDGMIQNRRFQIMRLEMELAHIDAVIKMFNPSYDLEAILPKRSFAKNPAGVPKGAGGRYALTILRESGEALTTVEIARRVLTKLKKAHTDEAIGMLAAAIHGTLSRRRDGAAVMDASSYPCTWRLRGT